MVADLTKPQELADLLNAFFSHTEPAHDNFEKAVDEFKQRVPDCPRHVVLCTLDEFWRYDFDQQFDEPLGDLSLDDLRDRWSLPAWRFP